VERRVCLALLLSFFPVYHKYGSCTGSPSTTRVGYAGLTPHGNPHFVAPTASVIGDVELGEGSTVWYQAIIRGDPQKVVIGKNTNIQDGAVVHSRSELGANEATTIGDNVTVGPNATIQASTLRDNCFIGIGAKIMDDVTIESNAIVGGGSVVTPGTIVSEGEVWFGSPAKKVRSVTEGDKEAIAGIVSSFVRLGEIHGREWHKSIEELIADEERRQMHLETNHEDQQSHPFPNSMEDPSRFV